MNFWGKYNIFFLWWKVSALGKGDFMVRKWLEAPALRDHKSVPERIGVNTQKVSLFPQRMAEGLNPHMHGTQKDLT